MSANPEQLSQAERERLQSILGDMEEKLHADQQVAAPAPAPAPPVPAPAAPAPSAAPVPSPFAPPSAPGVQPAVAAPELESDPELQLPGEENAFPDLSGAEPFPAPAPPAPSVPPEPFAAPAPEPFTAPPAVPAPDILAPPAPAPAPLVPSVPAPTPTPAPDILAAPAVPAAPTVAEPAPLSSPVQSPAPAAPDPFAPPPPVIEAVPAVAVPAPGPPIEQVAEPAVPVGEPPLVEPKLPEGSPLKADDYAPAFAEVENDDIYSTPLSAASSKELPEPRDLLFSVAIEDPEAEHTQTATKIVGNMRRSAAEDLPAKKRNKQKVKMEPLPFPALMPGTPLVVTIYSPSGGVGKSSTAMNMAVYIAAVAETMARKKRERGDSGEVRVPRILAIDGDIAMGSLALRLTGKLEPNIHDLQLYIDERKDQGFAESDAWPSSYDNPPVGEESMNKFVHWPDKLPNFNLLAAPKEPDLFWDFGPEEYKGILTMLGKFYDVIIIDAGTDLILESQRAWLQHANEVFLITSPEIDRIYNAAKAARLIAKRRPHPQDTREDAPLLPPLATRDKLSVVMTRCDSESGLNLERTVDYFFPWLDKNQKFWIPDVSLEMLQANNQGNFLVLDNPVYANVIGEMAKHVFQRYVTTRKQRGLPPAAE